MQRDPLARQHEEPAVSEDNEKPAVRAGSWRLGHHKPAYSILNIELLARGSATPFEPLADRRAHSALPAVDRLVADHLRPVAVFVDADRVGPAVAGRALASAPPETSRLSD